jgi:hypothetical protein
LRAAPATCLTDVFEDFAQNVEHATLQRFALDFELLQQAVVDIALAGFFSDEVPQMADFCLPDTVNAAEALL